MESTSILSYYLLVILAISGFCLGWRMITDDDKILHPIRYYCIDRYDKIPIWLSKPIILCEACFASFWGSAVYWLLWYGLDQELLRHTWVMWPLCCITASFINGILWALYELIRKY